MTQENITNYQGSFQFTLNKSVECSSCGSTVDFEFGEDDKVCGSCGSNIDVLSSLSDLVSGYTVEKNRGTGYWVKSNTDDNMTIGLWSSGSGTVVGVKDQSKGREFVTKIIEQVLGGNVVDFSYNTGRWSFDHTDGFRLNNIHMFMIDHSEYTSEYEPSQFPALLIKDSNTRKTVASIWSTGTVNVFAKNNGKEIYDEIISFIDKLNNKYNKNFYIEA